MTAASMRARMCVPLLVCVCVCVCVSHRAPLNYITNRMTAPLDAAADAIRFAGHVPDVPATGTTGSHV